MIKTQERSLPFGVNPVRLYRDLCSSRGLKNTLLLESADVKTKAGQKSFLMAQAALKITAREREVVACALSDLGEMLLEQLTHTPSLFPKSIEKSRIVFEIAARNSQESLSEQLHAKSCLDVLRDVLKLHVFAQSSSKEHFLTAGILSYDLIDQFEDLPGAQKDPQVFPDYVFWLPESFVEIDHVRNVTNIVHHCLEDTDAFVAETVALCEQTDDEQASLPDHIPLAEKESIDVDMGDGEYEALVEKLKKHVVCGDVFQIVPSRTFSMPCFDALSVYECLKAINPSPYMYFVADKEYELLGASPETFIKLDAATRLVDVKPIAGTRRRGLNANGEVDDELDSRLEAELRLDTKELSEHMMLVDLARNDIARVSKLGTRHVQRLLSVERYSHVMHLVSQVRGELAEGLDGLHAYQASMNMGTLVGAPKVKAAQLLREHELTKRATYGGAIGYMDAAGNFDTAIIIRSAYVSGGVARVRAGAGVVYDSVPEAEQQETRAKASAVLGAIAWVNAKRGAR